MKPGYPYRGQFESGLTLTELMIATAILSIGILGSVAAFRYIAQSAQNSKARTLASNLAQEKMQILKQQSYYRLLVTTGTAYQTDFDPVIPYDAGYYPPESILEGGIHFTRLTYVQIAQEDSGQIVTLPPTTPDTGLKRVLVAVIWHDGSTYKNLQINGVASNPDTVMGTAILTGRVRNAATTAGIPSASVNVAENVGWRDTAGATGDYTINLSPGNYNLAAGAEGYFPSMIPISIGANQTLTQNFDLTAMASGTVRGSAWINDHLIISQVVGSTEAPEGSGFFQEYVEVFNPTTWTWTVAAGGVPDIDLKYHKQGGALTTLPVSTYHVSTVLPGRYYLFANTGTVTAVGVARDADAEYSGNVIEVNGLDAGNAAAAVGIAGSSTHDWIDVVGWSRAGVDPPLMEGAAIVQANFGLENDEQFVRRTSTSGVTAGLGNAYDTGSNNVDFVTDGRQPMIYPPHNSSDAALGVSGTPAYGAVISATDGLSTPTTAYAAGDPPYAEFLLPAVATGTHFVSISSGNLVLEIDSVTVSASGTVAWTPNAATDPIWPSAGHYAAILSSVATHGFISGRVRNVTGGVISPSILVQAGDTALTVNSLGYYAIELSTGLYTVTANPGNVNGSYVSQDQTDVAVGLGQVTSDVNFVLSQGGRLQARVTRDGINPLPGVAVMAFDSNGAPRDEEVSGADGRVLLINLATGTYTVQTILDSGEAATPVSFNPTVTAGGTVFIGTFTIAGAFGTIAGSVSSGGAPIRTGVMIVASTAAIPSPPDLSAATLTGSTYYLGSSAEDGTFHVDVRGSTTTAYRVYGYYYTFDGAAPLLSSSSVTNVSVLPGETTSGVNFTW